VSRATIARHLAKTGLVVASPQKRPRSSYIRFQSAMPNECWRGDFTHYRLRRPGPAGRPGVDTEILSWLDDCSRYAVQVSAHARVTGPIVLAEFRQAVATQGIPFGGRRRGSGPRNLVYDIVIRDGGGPPATRRVRRTASVGWLGLPVWPRHS
jgi:transposase InsO family protein